MESINTNLTNLITPETNIPAKDAEQAQKEQFARDFESILIGKLLDEMKNTIGQWGYEQDGAAKQVQGLFWMNLSRELGQQGGLGLWKDIYQSLERDEAQANTAPVMDDAL